MNEMGNHVFASSELKSRKEIIPNLFTTSTHREQTALCMHSSKKFMEKFAPDTTNYDRMSMK